MTENAAAPSTDAPAAELQPAPAARIVTDKPTCKFVPLEWPVEFDGKVYHQIRVHRVTGKEMREFMDQIRSGRDDVLPPMVDCPVEVWEALDADDQFAIDQAAAEFMPRRLIDIQNAVVALDAGN